MFSRQLLLGLSIPLGLVFAGCAAPLQGVGQAGRHSATIERSSGYTEYGGFMPTTDRNLTPREAGCGVDIVLHGEPDQGFEVIGMVSAERVGSGVIGAAGGEEQVLEWLQDQGCRAGADVLFNVQTSSERGAYVGRALRGTAVAAVYTDGSRPAPPPEPVEPPTQPEPENGSSWGPPPPEAPEDAEVEPEPAETY